MSVGNGASVDLCNAIVDGTYPQSENLLTAELSPATVPGLLDQISRARREIGDEIQDSRKNEEAGDVGKWIAQAKKVQADIERCKLEARRIVGEHQNVQALRDKAADLQQKVLLLETEIDFTETLKQELHNVATTTKALRDVEETLSGDDPCEAARRLHAMDEHLPSIAASRTSLLTRNIRDELRLKTRVSLETKLHSHISMKRDPTGSSIEIAGGTQATDSVTSDSILQALDLLGENQEAVSLLTEKLSYFVLRPIRKSSGTKLASYTSTDRSLAVKFGKSDPIVSLVFDFVIDFIGFVHSSFESKIQVAVAEAILPDLTLVLVGDWLTPSLPVQISDFDRVDDLHKQVARVADAISNFGWPVQSNLADWLDQIPRIWLAKRKAATLDAVRESFSAASGVLRQVERVERQIVTTADEEGTMQDDWDASWDDDAKELGLPQAGSAKEDDDTSGWGFDDDDDVKADSKDIKDSHASNGGNAGDDGDDEGEAWGWDDDSPTEEKKPARSADEAATQAPNGTKKPKSSEQEVTLTEVFSITDIPDHIVEIVGRDVSDSQLILDQSHPALESSAASRGLLALPTLALAMFRATAPTYYGASPALTDMHRYNDSLYISSCLRNMAAPASMPNIESDAKAMDKFARSAYSAEMETQRIILRDLLEGAQGFTACTQFPYSQEIGNAVSAVVDRIRALHADWKPILSTSALAQSIGSLVSMVLAKVITSIEEMDDISEPESRKLTEFCQQFNSLDELFQSVPPVDGRSQADAAEPVSMTAVYVPNWFRFQYLINILESSLVDIKYLWTEGELSLEFSADEVVDLIKALFAESSHRRSAISAIKASRSS